MTIFCANGLPIKQRVTDIMLVKAINPESNCLSYSVPVIANFVMYNLIASI